MSTITINRMIEVLGDRKLLVPGCEPTSAISSTVLMAQQRRFGLCKSAIVDLQKALDAIPGSYLIFMNNFNTPRKRFFVLPPFDPESCNNPQETDWHAVLRSLAQDEAIVEEKYDHCNVVGTGFCPSPDFNIPHPVRAQDGGIPPNTYFGEGDSALFGNYTP